MTHPACNCQAPRIITDLLDQFHGDLPRLASAARLTPDEAHPYRGYRNFIALLRTFGDIVGGIAV